MVEKQKPLKDIRPVQTHPMITSSQPIFRHRQPPHKIYHNILQVHPKTRHRALLTIAHGITNGIKGRAGDEIYISLFFKVELKISKVCMNGNR